MTDALYQAIVSYHRAPSPIKRRHVGELVEQGHLDSLEAETLTRALRIPSAWHIRWPWRAGR
jgi:hypothetical protein